MTDTQIRRLSSTKLPRLFSTFVFFVDWVKDGLYDFSSLPLALKVHIQENDLAMLNQLPTKYTGSIITLLTEMKSLVDVLLHTEAHLIKEVNELSQVSTHVLSFTIIMTAAFFFFVLETVDERFEQFAVNI